jgi:hypothetical protein
VSVLTGATSLLQLLLFVGGLVVGILLRGRDGKAAVLVAIGFGVQIIGVVLSLLEGFAISAYVRSGSSGLSAVASISYGFGAALRLLELAACALIFFGLLRLVRRRPAVTAGVAR